MKQYLIIFVAHTFLVACTTTSKPSNYSYTETGRWIASAEDRANAKASAIMFLADQAISSCEAVDEVLQLAQEQTLSPEELGEELKSRMFKTDDEGNVSLRNPDCMSRIYALAGVMCDNTSDNELCEAVRIRKSLDAAILRIQSGPYTTEKLAQALEVHTQEQEKFKELIEFQPGDDITTRNVGKFLGIYGTGVGTYTGALGTAALAGLVPASAAILTPALIMVLGTLVVIEAGTLAYSLDRAIRRCKGTNIERCKRDYFGKVHGKVWKGILQVPISVIGRVTSFFGMSRRKKDGS